MFVRCFFSLAISCFIYSSKPSRAPLPLSSLLSPLPSRVPEEGEVCVSVTVRCWALGPDSTHRRRLVTAYQAATAGLTEASGDLVVHPFHLWRVEKLPWLDFSFQTEVLASYQYFQGIDTTLTTVHLSLGQEKGERSCDISVLHSFFLFRRMRFLDWKT